MAKRASMPVTPPELEEIVACLGVDAALTLVELRGGTEIHVPTPARCAGSFLQKHLGAEPLAKLSRSFGGTRLLVLLCKAWRAAIYLQRGDMSHTEIALALGMSARQVQRICFIGYVPKKCMPKSRVRLNMNRLQTELLLE